jgi:hypothetical protein
MAGTAAPASADHPYRYPLCGAHNHGHLAMPGFGVNRADG